MLPQGGLRPPLKFPDDSLDNPLTFDEPHWFPTELQSEETFEEPPNTEDTDSGADGDMRQDTGLTTDHRFSEFSSWSSEEGAFTCVPDKELIKQQDLQLPPVAMEWEQERGDSLPRDSHQRFPKFVYSAQWGLNEDGQSQSEDFKLTPMSNSGLTVLNQIAQGRLSKDVDYCSPSMDIGSSTCRSINGSLPQESGRFPVVGTPCPQHDGNRHTSPSATSHTEISPAEAAEMLNYGISSVQYEGHISALESKLRALKRRQEGDLSADLSGGHAVHIYRNPAESYYTEYEKQKLKSFPRDMLTTLGMAIRFGRVPNYTAEDIEPQLSDGEKHEVPIEPPRILSPCLLDSGNEDPKPITDFPSEPPVYTAVESPKEDPNLRYLHYETDITKLQTIDFGRLGLAEIGGAQEAEGMNDSSEMGQTFDMYATFLLVHLAARLIGLHRFNA